MKKEQAYSALLMVAYFGFGIIRAMEESSALPASKNETTALSRTLRDKKRKREGSLLQATEEVKKPKRHSCFSEEDESEFACVWYWLPVEMRVKILHMAIGETSPKQELQNLKRLALVNRDFKKIGKEHLLQSLIARIATASTIDSNKRESNFEKACCSGDNDTVDAFFNEGVVCSDQTVLNALLKAARKNHVHIVERLLKAGALQIDGSFFSSQLLSAIIEKRPTVLIERLIENGANVNAKDIHGMTPLLFAVNNGDLGTADLLINKGADLKAKNAYGENALLLATKNNDLFMVELLVKNGMSLSKKNRCKETPLLVSARIST